MPPACDPVRAAIAAYRDGGSSPERLAEAAAHLQECPECRTLLQEVVETADERLVVRALEAHVPRGGIADGVVRRIRAGDPGSQAPAPAVEDDEYEAMARSGGSGPRGRSGMGMMIEYCLKCRERIDPADFRNGTAIQWKGQSFCGNCKAEVLPKLEKDPAFVAAQKAAARPGSGRHEAAGDRPGTGRRPRSGILAPQGPNVKLIVGIGGGVAAVALIGAIAMTMGGPGTGTPSTPPIRPTTAGVKHPVRGGGGKTPSTSATTVPDGPAALSPATEAKLDGITGRLNSRLVAVRKFVSENEMDFPEIDLKYKSFLEEDEWKDADVQKYEKLQKLRTDVVAEKDRHQQRLQALVKDEVDKAISRAMAFADRGDYGTAHRQLDGVPRYIPAASEEARKRIADAHEEVERKQKSKFGDFAMGQWVVVYEGKPDARWSISGEGASIKQDEADQAMVVTGPTQGTGLLVFQGPDRERWADYEIEMTVQPQEGAAIGLRLGRDPNRPTQLTGEIVRFDAEDAKAFRVYRLKLEGQRFVAEQDGKQLWDRPTDFLRGPPMFALTAGKVVRIKAFKIRVTKSLG